MERRLAAILAADVVGYSRLIRADEEGTLAALKALRAEKIDPKLAEHNGRIVKLMGDGMLAEFHSVVDAVRAAVETQLAVAERNAGVAEDKRIEFRVGVNLGDVVIDGDDIHGDGVNVAARLEGLAEPGGVCVSDKVHDEVRDRLDWTFEDMGEQRVKNIDRPVRAWRWLPGERSTMTAKPPGKPAPPSDRPSIAVLPFDNMSADPEQEYFADGIAEDIITELSRIRGIFVIARNSSFIYKGRTIAVSDIARELGVRYVLEGSVRRAGSRVRVTAQLIEGETESHLWAERYDRDLEDIFDVQDEITQRIVGALEPSLITAEAERSTRQRPENLDAWSYVARALPLIWTWSAKDYALAEPMLLKAIEIDPTYARARSILAVGLMTNAWFGRAGPHEDFVDRALEEARAAVALDEQDPWAHTVLGFVFGYTRNRDDAIAEMERALRLNPNFALAHGLFGLVLAWAGDPGRALEELDVAARLSPHDDINGHHPTIRGVAHFVAGDYEASVATAKETVRMRPDSVGAYRVLVVGLAHLGKLDEARAAAGRLKELQPGISLRWVEDHNPLFDSEMRARYVDGLRKAGVPD